MRKKFAEMLWLALPAVVLGGVGLFFKMRGPSQSDGPLRVELGKFQSTEVAPVDVFQGYRYQISSPARILGSPPDEMRKLSEPRWDGLYSVSALEVQRHGKWTPWQWGKKSPSTTVVNTMEGDLTIKVALPDKAPADIEALRVKGDAIGHFSVEVPAVPGAKPNGVYRTSTGFVYGTNGRFHTQQKLAAHPFSEIIWKRGQPWPQTQAKKNTALSLVQVGKAQASDGWGFYELKCKPSDRRHFYFEADVAALDPDATLGPVTVIRAELLDEKQRVLATDGDGHLGVRYSGTSFHPSERKPKPQLFEGAFDDRIGGKVLQLRVYVSQNSEWPAHLDIPLREAWQARNSQLLRLQSVKLIKSPSQVYQAPLSVEVTARYLGQKKLWSFNRDAATPPAITIYGGGRTQEAPPAGYEKLLFDEQPYLRNEVDEIIKNKAVGMGVNPVYSGDPVLRPDGTLTLLFPLYLEPGHKFKAATFSLNLGIAGDGVLKIRQPLPVQKLLQAGVVQPTPTPVSQ